MGPLGDSHQLTRRDYITGGSTFLGSALLAGCTSSGGDTGTPKRTTTDQTTPTSDGSYTATLRQSAR